MLCAGVTLVKKSPAWFLEYIFIDTAGLHLLTFRILESYPFKDIEFDLRHVTSH